MEVSLCVSKDIDISLVESEFGKMSEAYPRYDSDLVDYYLNLGSYYEGDDGYVKWLSYDESVRFCGFCSGAIQSSTPWITGNDNWAQGLIGLRDFSGYAFSPADKAERLRVSDIYWDGHRKGQEVAGKTQQV